MNEVCISIREQQPDVVASSHAEIDAILSEAAQESREQDRLNIIFITIKNGNSMSVVVGSNETVLTFMYSHHNPPYYVSRGTEVNDDPVLTAFIALEHHTEYPRQWVIDMQSGMRAIHEFVESGALPMSVTWERL